MDEGTESLASASLMSKASAPEMMMASVETPEVFMPKEKESGLLSGLKSVGGKALGVAGQFAKGLVSTAVDLELGVPPGTTGVIYGLAKGAVNTSRISKKTKEELARSAGIGIEDVVPIINHISSQDLSLTREQIYNRIRNREFNSEWL